MTESRKRLIARRATMLVAGIVLSGYVYVASYFALVWASFQDYIPEWHMVAVYKPLNKYNRSDLLGSGEFRAIKHWMMNPDQSFVEAFRDQMDREAERQRMKQQLSQASVEATRPEAAAEANTK